MNYLALSALLGYTQAQTTGCKASKHPGTPGESVHQQLKIKDPATGDEYTREYYVNLPKDYNSTTEYQMILWFHGWRDESPRTKQPFVPVGQANNIITVYPVGLADYSADPT